MPLYNPSFISASAPPPTSNHTRLADIPASIEQVTLLYEDARRKGVTIWNDSLNTLSLDTFTNEASFAVKITPGGYYEFPFNYIGLLVGIWDGTNGFARIREFYYAEPPAN
ncbi:hypothetical protein OGM63_19570 [Plectonema radiosum NIES-515]|uniref:Uncharacterized protein n=1 Tax=Plectonema radiosum NIES-515 TaxID=2986073 RepID=A0ABT3B2T1_9CYAN|nr:hypothetical protein [Plectonema radiosum]MCV3215684.1 hypothetical protein [Plectonema radiosum NIES-515]